MHALTVHTRYRAGLTGITLDPCRVFQHSGGWNKGIHTGIGAIAGNINGSVSSRVIVNIIYQQVCVYMYMYIQRLGRADGRTLVSWRR